jgi:translation initiation factor 2B subunit (eIF-2B alpha/beta/delta family)
VFKLTLVHIVTQETTQLKSYTEVEVGYPNRMEPLLQQYCEEPDKPCDTVYGYVPAALVSLVITKHGGLVEGEVPNGVLLYDKLSKEIQ